MSSRASSCTATRWISTFTTLSVGWKPYVRSPPLSRTKYYLRSSSRSQISAKHINSLVELITSNIDNIHSTDVHPSAGATSGLIEGVNTAEAVVKHFRNTLMYIQGRKDGHSHDGDAAADTARLFAEVDVAGPLLKLSSV
jgi:hypothetical protein